MGTEVEKKGELGFDIVDRPKDEIRAQDRGKKAGDAEDMDVLEVLLSGKAIERTIDTKRGAYRVRYPSGKDRFQIDRRRAIRRAGVPAEAFDDYGNFNNLIWSTLDVVVIEGPEWYRRAKAADSAWSWEDCPDEEHTMELYRQVGTFRGDVAKRIQGSRLGEAAPGSGSAPPSAPVGDGAFSGIAFGSKT